MPERAEKTSRTRWRSPVPGAAGAHKAVPADPTDLARRALHRRAVEAAIWGMPMVSVDAMRTAFLRDAGAADNDIVYLSRPADWRFRVTTPNGSSRYVFMHLDTRAGPLVLEVPPAEGAGLFGSLNDAWQVPVLDVGPAGEDRGRGGRYLIAPPGYHRSVPLGYIAAPFATYNGYSVLRAIPDSSSSEDVATALELVQRLRLYPLARADDPPEQRFIDMAGKLFDGIPRFDASFYEGLARMVDEEPVQQRDLVTMGLLRSLGIRKNQPFAPDPALREILEEGIAEAHAIFMAGAATGERFWPGSRWITPGSGVAQRTLFTFQTEDYLDLDERGASFFLGCAPPRRLGAASFYIWGVRDREGVPLEGGRSYRLRVPAHVPARQFWAVTVYDLETAGFIRDSPRVELNSYQHDVRKNADGSVEVRFGPDAPPDRESNWIYTAPGKPWIAAFRCYGPEQALFDRSWALGDIERA